MSADSLHHSKQGESKLRHNAFTLIELMVVMAVICMLAGLILSAAGYLQKKGARSRAEGEIAALAAALENYKADTGDYPTNNANSSSSNNSCLVTNLMSTNGGKIYFEFKTNSLTNNNTVYLDPFGNPYNYVYTANGFNNATGSTNNGINNYDLWSTAGGSSTNTNTWIKNW
jgi:prepilin-type N-terminal cleavage/methylation domain-containing protein